MPNNAKTAYDYFVSTGWTPEQASAIVGNLMKESSLKTTAEGDKGYKGGSSLGVAQWRGDRLNRLKSMYGDNWTSLKNQLEFVNWELQNTEKDAGDSLKRATNIWDAGKVFTDKYERPKYKFHQDKERQKHVFNTYSSFSGNKVEMPNFEDEEVVLFKDPIVQAPETSEVSYLADPSLFSNFTKEKDAKSAQEELIQAQQQKQNENEFIQNLISQAQVQFVDPEKDNSFQDGGVIEDNLGQWKYPGQVTKINSPNITMKEVPFKVLGIADTGEKKMMMPNKDYVFKGAKSVTEYPQLEESEKNFLKDLIKQ
jgi:hypothetical protein